jgi:hypothetical protein
MATRDLQPGTVIKFKNHARLQLFYERYEPDWSDYGGSMKTMDVHPEDVMTIMKTSQNGLHIGQTVFINGRPRVIYYQTNSFFDMNQGVIAQIDVTADNYYYDILET